MPGQPLSTFRGIDDLTFGPGSVFQRPTLAPSVMLVIERWAQIESMLLLMVNDCLRSDPIVATAMLHAVDSQAAQRASILAAVKAVLPPDDWALFQAGFNTTLPSRIVRNQFVHDQWGVSPQLPDALLLLSLKASNAEHAKRIVRVAERMRNGGHGVMSGETTVNPEGASVWRENDFQSACVDAERAQVVMSRLWHLVARHQSGRSTDSTRQWLLREPAIQQRIQKANKQT